jgi:16S rRNA (guanine966-N2)-methyltransferase
MAPSMRIVGGTLGGRTLRAPRGDRTRPTSERVREALMNILGGGFAEATRVLDLYAGAGALGIEAISRGAGHATFVDQAGVVCRVIRDNLTALGVADRTTVVTAPVARALERLVGPFHLVFIDPPYATDEAIETLGFLGDSALLGEERTVVVEHDRRREPGDRYGSLQRFDQRRYGDTGISFFR